MRKATGNRQQGTEGRVLALPWLPWCLVALVPSSGASHAAGIAEQPETTPGYRGE